MNAEKTRAFYSKLSSQDICGCAYCQNYIRQIRAAYPAAADYLSYLGVPMKIKQQRQIKAFWPKHSGRKRVGRCLPGFQEVNQKAPARFG